MKVRKRKSLDKTHIFGQPFIRPDMDVYKLDRKTTARLRASWRKSDLHKLFYRDKCIFKFIVIHAPLRTIAPLLEKKISIPGGHDDPQLATILSDKE